MKNNRALVAEKKIYSLILILVWTLSVSAYDFTANDVNGNTIYYIKLGGDSVEVVNNGSTKTYSGNIVIPDNVSDGTNTYRVTTIGSSAFESSTLSSLSLPLGIQEIKGNAFYNATVPGDLYLPKLRILGGSAFRLCWQLKKIIMPNLKQVGAGALADCYDLKKILIPEELKTLSGRFFDSDILLENVHLPKALTAIPDNCFRACWSLSQITIPDHVTSIGENAFLGCNRLKAITVPKNVTTIGNTFAGGDKVGTWWGANWYDPNRVTPDSPQLNRIYFECTTPPQVTSTTFGQITKSKVTCYVPEEAVETYKANSLYLDAFANIVGYRMGESNVDNITLHSADIRWRKDSLVMRYQIHICHAGDTIAEYVLDSAGTIISSIRKAPEIHRLSMDTTTTTSDYFVLTVDDLDSGTDYNYDIQGTDVNEVTMYHNEGSFRTVGTEGIAPLYEDDQSPITDKFLHNGVLYIRRGDKIYTIHGTIVN